MKKNLEKLKKDPEFINSCEIDMGRHSVINILSEDPEISENGSKKLAELLELVSAENERFLKNIMKVCICSKAGAEHILDELIDELDKIHPETYFIEKAALTAFLETEEYSFD